MSATWKPRSRFSKPIALSSPARPRAGPWASAPGTTLEDQEGDDRDADAHRRAIVTHGGGRSTACRRRGRARPPRTGPIELREHHHAATAGSSTVSTGRSCARRTNGAPSAPPPAPATTIASAAAEQQRRASQNGKKPLLGPVGAPADAPSRSASATHEHAQRPACHAVISDRRAHVTAASAAAPPRAGRLLLQQAALAS